MTAAPGRGPVSATGGLPGGYTGKDLHVHMLVAEVTKAELAALCGVTPRAVEQWLSGARPVPALVRRVVRGIALGCVSREALKRL